MSNSLPTKVIVTPASIEAAIARINLKQARETWNMTNELADEQLYLFRFIMASKDYYPEKEDFEYLLACTMVVYDAYRRDNPEPAFVPAELIGEVQKETFEFFNSFGKRSDQEGNQAKVMDFLRQSRQGALLKFAYSHAMGNPDIPRPYQSSMFSMLKVVVDSLDRA